MFILPVISTMGGGGGGGSGGGGGRGGGGSSGGGGSGGGGGRGAGSSSGGGRGGGARGGRGGTGGSGGGRGPTPGEGHAELEISSIEVSPAQPPAGEDFGVRVEVTNVGETTSGDYDLETGIVGRSDKETLSGTGLKPGKSRVFPSRGWVVKVPGKRRMRAEIEPSPGDSTRNSPRTKPFTVKKGKPKRKA